MAIERKHSTSVEAATIAKKSKVKILIITHISTRYKDAEPLLREAKKIFKNTILATDGLRLAAVGS